MLQAAQAAVVDRVVLIPELSEIQEMLELQGVLLFQQEVALLEALGQITGLVVQAQVVQEVHFLVGLVVEVQVEARVQLALVQIMVAVEVLDVVVVVAVVVTDRAPEVVITLKATEV